ncbi:MAG: hypothetical protein HC825_04490 [Oscillatoriales cyanobacterium RM1_1_9]|nr:hypothetical protein [Oscillatoriales cyanobacterium SM2_3_0]NJO46210.1 hypothetical protein [Oscillatoriales cyanobacterium RM2_1_1]NJO71154.1 hypothetical protein [Oscillatoriales cyanobacterium RM1_1_9]
MSIQTKLRSSQSVLSRYPVRPVKGIKVVRKLGHQLYCYPEAVPTQPDYDTYQITPFNSDQWPDQLTEWDGFYCLNHVTQTISYLGSEWCDIAPGLKFRGLANF